MVHTPDTSTQPNTTMIAWVLLFIGVMCIGFSAIFIKIAAVPGPVSAFYRTCIATIVVVPLAFSRKSTTISRGDLIVILAGGVFFALDLAFWNASILLTSAATATFLANNAPLWTGLGAMIFFKEKLSYNYWIGLCIALSASCLLMGKDVLLNASPGKGALFALIASVFYAAYLLTTQKVRVKVDTLKFMAISSIATSTVLLAYNVITGHALTGFPLRTWVALLGIGLISHLGGWLSINYALGHLRASQVSISLLGQTVVTAILAIPILGENLSIGQVMGGVLVITGIYFVNKR